MDFLKDEIARKKKQLVDSNILKSGKHYFKRGDLSAKEEIEYWKREKRFKPNIIAEELENQHSSSAPESDKEEPQRKREYKLARKDVIKRLRDRHEPIRLFGESDEETLQRLKKLEVEMPDINKGYSNDLKTAMDKVDEEYNEEIFRNVSNEDVEKKVLKMVNVDVRGEGEDLDDIINEMHKLGKTGKAFDSDTILRYLKLILWRWGSELNNRTQEEKLSYSGRLSSATHRQTVEYIMPLFKKLKKHSLDEDLLSCLVDITRHLLQKNYIKANDAYVEMAIGNSPWPIGVTMVGIHARTGREKISAKNIAHVLNDETQRKYIQALKRLMTKAQNFYPTDPARSVNFERTETD